MNMLKLAAAAAAAAAGLGAAAYAHPHPDGEGEKVRKFVIMEAGDGKVLKDGTRVKVIDRAALLAKCEGEKTEVDETTGEDGKQRTRIVICSKGEGDPAARAERLEKAIERLAENEALSAEHRERLTTALREELERARAAR